MPLSAGDRLGPYEILAPIGAGGMGEVYRARDTRLGRDVAIKVSQERFSDRFEREARAVAALNHLNICTLYDIGPNYLVMELIEGESPRGPLPLDESLRIARQIASALDAAHSKGIVHRDLKPGNIKIKPDGTVKVLDFGLAKTVEAPAGDPENSPTMTVSTTRAGMIMGTAAYMSPEQARGKAVDKRADIWAFGVVFYELLTGARPFHGEDLTEILASVVKDAPDLSKAPVKARRLIAKCLEKDAEKRLRDIGDAWGFLDEPAVAPKSGVMWPWVAAAVVLGGVVGMVGWLRPGTKDAPPLTFDLVPPAGMALHPIANVSGVPEISPDGSAVLYRTGAGAYVRRLDSLESKLVPGSELASNPAFWSADSSTVVYPAASLRQLRKVRMPDGAPQSIALMEKASMGGSWSDAGTILLAISWMLYLVPAGGGEPKLLEMPDRLGDGRNTYAEFLAGSEDFLFFHSTPEDPGEGSIYLATLRDGKAVNPSLLLRNATPVRYTPAGGGRILFVRSDNLYSQKLNRSSRKLEGEAELVVQGIASGARADFSVARNATLAWRPGSAAYTQGTEFDREGHVVGTSGPKAIMQSLRLSPDEKQLLATGDNGYIGSLVDIGQTGRIDLPKGVGWIGWLAGGSKLIGRRAGAVVVMPAAGSGEVREIRSLEADFSPMTVSPDGKSLGGPYRHAGSFFAPVKGAPEEVKPREIAEGDGISPLRFSPDGRWVLYGYVRSSGGGVYVQPFPGPGQRHQISSAAGKPVWRGDGKEILYADGDSVVSIAVEGGGTPTFGAPRKLFSGLREGAGGASTTPLEVSRDGSRIFYLQAVEQPESNVIHVRIGAVR